MRLERGPRNARSQLALAGPLTQGPDRNTTLDPSTIPGYRGYDEEAEEGIYAMRRAIPSWGFSFLSSLSFNANFFVYLRCRGCLGPERAFFLNRFLHKLITTIAPS